ncbi:hypothetical protein PsYK624_001650 [Phanerochaete sordida]|uniref:Uncharacterized protein n=1 Tax=Phanerochaete sordida TaxID=48140 RepID=A0A9P3FXJ9_9APHY|nr:hypothetical protein PsYK624_001650 [Phanerochaete sordida]
MNAILSRHPDTAGFTSVPTADSADTDEPLDMPDHWNLNFTENAPKFVRLPLRVFLKLLCLASLGHASMESYWKVCREDERTWLESTDRLMDRLNAIVLVAGLVLSSTAAFVTTAPPTDGDFNYNVYAAYILLLISFLSSLGTLMVGAGIAFVLAKCDRDWFVDTHLGSQSRILCTMYIIAYPFCSMSFSGTMAALGLLVSAFNSPNELIAKGGHGIWLLFWPLSCLFGWYWTQVPVRNQKLSGLQPSRIHCECPYLRSIMEPALVDLIHSKDPATREIVKLTMDEVEMGDCAALPS